MNNNNYKNMKINKNIILTLMIPALIFSAVKIASADVDHVIFVSTDSTGKITTTVDISVEHRLNGGTYGKFKGGDTIYPYLYINPKQDIRCANGVTQNQALYLYKYNLEIGKPDNTKYLTLKKLAESPSIYMDYDNSTVYLKDGARVFSAYDGAYISRDNIRSSYPSIPVNASEIRVKSGSLDNLRVETGGKLVGSFTVEYFEYSGTKTSDVYDGILTTDSILNAYANTYINTFRPTITEVSTGMRPILSGTYVYGMEEFPSSIYIPTNADPGKYVAQFKFRPSYTAYTPTRNVINKGWWNTAGTQPAPVVTYKNCLDGSKVVETGTCYKNCPDGSRIPEANTCPSTKTCLDGSVVLSTATCYKTCPDGSRIVETTACPSTKVCLDGSVVLSTATCYKDCPDGSRIRENLPCPEINLPCPPGQICREQPALYKMDSDNNKFSFNNVLKFLKIKTAEAQYEASQRIAAELIMMNGGGGGGGSYTPPTPPATCDSTSWYCKIMFFEVPLSDSFEILSTNTSPSVLVN